VIELGKQERPAVDLFDVERRQARVERARIVRSGWQQRKHDWLISQWTTIPM
jgi:hypothetical protein